MKNLLPNTLKKIVSSLEEKKAVDVLILDVRDLFSYTDYIVLCSGTSTTHVNSLVVNVENTFAKGEGPVYVNPSRDDSWWVIDFVDVVVHVFRQDIRSFYDLEGLWCDAKNISV